MFRNSKSGIYLSAGVGNIPIQALFIRSCVQCGMLAAKMQTRIPTIAIALITAVAGGVFVMTLVNAVFYAPDSGGDISSLQASFVPPAPEVAQSTSVPVRLLIPSLSVNARVQYVGMNKKGEMGIPNNFSDVAWYKYGPVPGQLGSAVMAGHVDNGLALPGVFRRLGEMKEGDDVYVIAKDGSKLRFVVQSVETYPYDEGPVERVFGASDAARLNLITCSGAWLRGKRTYAERTVVYTTYVETVQS